MFDNSEYYVDGVRKDIQRLIDLGYRLETAVEILKIAELRLITSCINYNSYRKTNDFAICGTVGTHEE